MSFYINAKEPVAVAFPTLNVGCCGGGGPTGAQAASSPEDHRSNNVGGVGGPIAVLTATSGAANDLRAQLAANGKSGRGHCRCWWVALAAVVVIALVANKS